MNGEAHSTVLLRRRMAPQRFQRLNALIARNTPDRPKAASSVRTESPDIARARRRRAQGAVWETVAYVVLWICCWAGLVVCLA